MALARSRARRLARLVCAASLLGLLLYGAPHARSARAAEAEPAFRVVVHPQNPEAALDRGFVADALLKKTTRWADGEGLQPVDLRPDSSTRRKFSEAVLKRSIAAVRSYWQQRIFSGRGVPPPELDSDAAIISYVASHRGGIGYVSAGAKLGEAKVVALK